MESRCHLRFKNIESIVKQMESLVFHMRKLRLKSMLPPIKTIMQFLPNKQICKASDLLE